jgi:hypothetical protein
VPVLPRRTSPGGQNGLSGPKTSRQEALGSIFRRGPLLCGIPLAPALPLGHRNSRFSRVYGDRSEVIRRNACLRHALHSCPVSAVAVLKLIRCLVARLQSVRFLGSINSSNSQICSTRPRLLIFSLTKPTRPLKFSHRKSGFIEARFSQPAEPLVKPFEWAKVLIILGLIGHPVFAVNLLRQNQLAADSRRLT